MTEYIGIGLMAVGLVAVLIRVKFLYRKARVQRLVQAFIDELVELYDSESVDKH